jgi:signal transduction histidine kinase
MSKSRPFSSDERVDAVFDGHLGDIQARTDRVFGWLLVGQWLFGVACALMISPLTWVGAKSSIHVHVWAATLLGAVIISLPLTLIVTMPGRRGTKYVVASAQLLYSSLLIQFMGGRIEAHFHVFGSLAILAFYRDAKVFVPAVLLIFVDHFLRSLFWPESVFGITVAAPWRTFEHAAWILFETTFLVWGVAQSRADLLRLSKLQVSLTDEKNLLEDKVETRVAELNQQRHLLQVVIDNIPGAVFWKDSNSRYLGCNRSFAAAAELSSPDNIVGVVDSDLPWPQEQIDRDRESDRQVLESLKPSLNVEDVRLGSGGERKTFLTSKAPLLNSTGQTMGVIGFFQDISDRKLLETQLSQAQKLESIGQLAAGIAHEINTPMQCVGGNVEFLKTCYQQVFNVVDTYRAQLVGPKSNWQQRKEEMDRLIVDCRYDMLREEAPAAIEEAADAVQRVIEIVRAMKAMSHPGTKAKVSTNINELIRNAAAISRNRWKYVADMELQFEEPLPDVQALPAELSQVFLNLIVNAADAIVEKYGETPLELGKITICTSSDANGVRIDVQDTGVGITDEVRHRIFDPFFTTKEVGKGTGQGLAIAYDLIVNKHLGRITIDPGPNKGATFSVWLPCRCDLPVLNEANGIASGSVTNPPSSSQHVDAGHLITSC